MSGPQVRASANPPGLSIGPLNLPAVEHGGRWWADVPPLGRMDAESLEALAATLQNALDDFHTRARGMDAQDLEKALETAHRARAQALARRAKDSSLEAARQAREAAQRYALLVLMFMPLLGHPAPRWRLG